MIAVDELKKKKKLEINSSLRWKVNLIPFSCKIRVFHPISRLFVNGT